MVIQNNISDYALTRQLKRKQHGTDCNVYHNRFINRVLICSVIKTWVTKHAQR